MFQEELTYIQMKSSLDCLYLVRPVLDRIPSVGLNLGLFLDMKYKYPEAWVGHL